MITNDGTEIPNGQPLLLSSEGDPIVYPVLGATLHLESLKFEDEERLRQAAQYVAVWYGSQLNWTENSTFPLTLPYNPESLEYIPGYTKTLHWPDAAPDIETTHVHNCLYAATFGQFSIYFTGAQGEATGSPYSLDFSAEMYEEQDGGPLYTCGVFIVTVPTGWPLDDFQARVRHLVELLPVRWGAAGLTYSSWLSMNFEGARQAIYAHARRHPGFDMGQTEAYYQEWHQEMRSVNWLTYVGEEFATRLRQAKRQLVSTPGVSVTPIGSVLEFQAGLEPQAGDSNRLLFPRAYARVDELVRPVRASSGIDFTDPWTARTSEDWLRRFERRPI